MDPTPRGDADPTTPASLARQFAWSWVWTAIAVAAVVGALVGYLLWGKTTAEHKDAFDTAWKSSAAILAILATVISVERFRLSQREHHRQLQVDRFTRADAVARQITDLSAKASEQLGSDKAAVRIGGLTDLERLGQAHVDLRQTVVDRVCAYLRAPYRPPYGDTPPGPDDEERPSAGQPGLDDEEVAARRLELDVRRTAQQILKRHLHWPRDAPEPPAQFWADINLDLRDALLIEFDLAHCRTGGADFQGARFHSVTQFTGATFAGDAKFSDAEFVGNAEFDHAVFSEGAAFIRAAFSRYASFQGAYFWSGVFIEATFAAAAVFNAASFGRGSFNRAVFSSDAHFDGAVVSERASFSRTVFSEGVGFARATLSGDVSFRRATVKKTAMFFEAVFSGVVDFTDAKFEDMVESVQLGFGAEAVQFDHSLILDGARVAHPEAAHSFPPRWRAEPAEDGSGRLVPVKKK